MTDTKTHELIVDAWDDTTHNTFAWWDNFRKTIPLEPYCNFADCLAEHNAFDVPRSTCIGFKTADDYTLFLLKFS